MTLVRQPILTLQAWIALACTLLHVLPLAYHALGRLNGSIPDSESWDRLGGNHGPLWHRSEGSILPAVLTVQVLTVPAVLAVAVVSLSGHASRSECLKWLLLLIYATALVWFVSPVWAWTID